MRRGRNKKEGKEILLLVFIIILLMLDIYLVIYSFKCKSKNSLREEEFLKMLENKSRSSALPTAFFIGGTPDYSKAGDLDGDGDIDFEDFAIFADDWGCPASPDCGAADIDGDGDVDLGDFEKFVKGWGK